MRRLALIVSALASAPAVAQDTAPALLVVIPAEAPPEPILPAEVRAMIEAAIASGDKAAAETVLRFARLANADAAGEIGAIEAGWRKELAARDSRATEERIARLQAAGILSNWKGQVELGASRSTGDSSSLGLYAALDVEREGLEWRHKFKGRVDFQRTNGVTSNERVNLSYQPNLKFDERLYAFGLGQYEHNRFSGYDDRVTAGGGLGYGVVDGPRFKLDLEGGPALRYTDAIDALDTTRFVGRASMRFKWQITPTLQLAQDSAVYLEEGDSNATASTSLDTKLIGALKARFSYNVQYEDDARPGANSIDTQSRATFVYSF